LPSIVRFSLSGKLGLRPKFSISLNAALISSYDGTFSLRLWS